MFCQAEGRGAPRNGLWERRLGTRRVGRGRGRETGKAKDGKGQAELKMEVKEWVEEATWWT